MFGERNINILNYLIVWREKRDTFPSVNEKYNIK